MELATKDPSVAGHTCELIGNTIRRADLRCISSLCYRKSAPTESTPYALERLTGSLYGIDEEGRCRIRVSMNSTDEEISAFEIKLQGYDVESSECVYGTDVASFNVSPIHHPALARCLDTINRMCTKVMTKDTSPEKPGS